MNETVMLGSTRTISEGNNSEGDRAVRLLNRRDNDDNAQQQQQQQASAIEEDGNLEYDDEEEEEPVLLKKGMIRRNNTADTFDEFAHSERQQEKAAAAAAVVGPQQFLKFEDAEVLPYFDPEVDFYVTMRDNWNALLASSQLLRSPHSSDQISGCESIVELIDRLTALENSLALVAVQRCVVEVSRLREAEGDDANDASVVVAVAVAAIHVMLQRVDGNEDVLSDMYEMECERIRLISAGDWDGQATMDEHVEQRQCRAKQAHGRRRRRRCAVMVMVVLAGVPMFSGIAVLVFGFLILSSDQADMSTIMSSSSSVVGSAFAPFTAAASLLCAFNTMLVSLMLSLLPVSNNNAEATVPFLNLRVIIIVLPSLYLSVWGLRVFYTVSEDSEQAAQMTAFVQSAITTHIVVLVLALSLVSSWIPGPARWFSCGSSGDERRVPFSGDRPGSSSRSSWCCNTIYAPSLSHWMDNGFWSFKFFKPLYRDRDAILSQLTPTVNKLKKHQRLAEQANLKAAAVADGRNVVGRGGRRRKSSRKRRSTKLAKSGMSVVAGTAAGVHGRRHRRQSVKHQKLSYLAARRLEMVRTVQEEEEEDDILLMS